jgi:uncharacterized cupin superfamily protein
MSVNLHNLIAQHEASRNQNEGKTADGMMPCVICGKLTKITDKTNHLHVHAGGALIVNEDEAASMDSGGDMYFFPVGNDCLRRHPELKPYVQHFETVPA